jgi:NAD(P)-dependent dehydrogenase (short-subunit alcohol dehydrogenase family)
MRLDGKVAIVTGASRGIGTAIAHRLASEGARVVITARHPDALKETARSIEHAGGTVLAVAGDAGVRDDVEAMFQKVLDTWNTVDILVNNAAWAAPYAHFLEMDQQHWDAVIRSNLTSVYLHCHRAANIMVDHGTRGSIINISSYAAVRSHRIMAAYDASKGGMETLTRSMAIDLAPFGIRVNVVSPGAIQTEAYHPVPDPIPLGRGGHPEEIAAVVAFVASEDASYITGQSICVDGGMLAQLRPPQMDLPLPDSVRARLRS